MICGNPNGRCVTAGTALEGRPVPKLLMNKHIIASTPKDEKCAT
jgi:hypothetical protein